MEIFIAYAPRGAGLRCALAYLEQAGDVYGWFAGPCSDASVAARYFLLQGLRAGAQTCCEAVDQSALDSWGLLDEPRRRELAQMQKAFAREWLFYRNEPRATVELLAYCNAELAAGDINVRFERLARLSKQQPNWLYSSPRFDPAVLHALSRDWPLEYFSEASGRRSGRAAARAHPDPR